MSKATLSFNLPEEDGAFKMAPRGGDYYCALMEISRVLREHRKYDKSMRECWDEIDSIAHEAKLDDIE